MTSTANGQNPRNPEQSAGPPASFQAFPLKQDPDWDGELASRFQKPTASQLGCEIQLEVWQPGNPPLSCPSPMINRPLSATQHQTERKPADGPGLAGAGRRQN